jgi:hypothetical protein
MAMDVIDFEIKGSEMQFVAIERALAASPWARPAA